MTLEVIHQYNYEIKKDDIICREVVDPNHVNKKQQPKLALFAHSQLIQEEDIKKLSVFILSIATTEQIQKYIVNEIESSGEVHVIGFLSSVCEEINKIRLLDLKTVNGEPENIEKFGFTDEQLQTHCFDVVYCPDGDFISHAVIGYSGETKQIVEDCISRGMEDIKDLIRSQLLYLFRRSGIIKLQELNFST